MKLKKETFFLYSFYAILITLLGFIIISYSTVIELRSIATSEFMTFQENVAEQSDSLNRVFFATYKAINYNASGKDLETVTSERFVLDRTIIRHAEISKMVNKKILEHFLQDDPLYLLQRNRESDKAYTSALLILSQILDEVMDSKYPETTLLLDDFRSESQAFMLILEERSRIYLQIEASYYSYQKSNLEHTISLLNSYFIFHSVMTLLLFIISFYYFRYRFRTDKELDKHRNHLSELVKSRTAELTDINEKLKNGISERGRIENELREKEGQLSWAQKVAHLGNWSTNLETNEGLWSDEQYRIFGFFPGIPEKITLDTFFSRIHPEDREKVRKTLEKATIEEPYYEINFKTIPIEGVERNIHAQGEIESDASGKPVRIIGTDQDVTILRQSERHLEQALAEKEVLLKEVYHRVKNNLVMIASLVNLQKNEMQDQQAIDSFEELQKRLNAIAIIHEKLYRSTDLTNISMKEYIKDLVDTLIYSLSSNPIGIDLDLEAHDIQLPAEIIIPLGLIVTEIVTNSLKYAFHGKQNNKILIHYREESNNVYLIIGDNGNPPVDKKMITQSQSLGMRLVYILTEQINGTLDLDISDGTMFSICFPRSY
jgi:two-component sensor histidine kinase/PAS domain-containing protein